MIFEPQQSPREVQVYGANLLSLSKDEQKDLGYPVVHPLPSLDDYLSFLFGGGEEHDLWVRLGFADKPDGARFETGRDYAAEYNNPYGQELPGDRDAFVKLRERYPAANFRECTGAIDADAQHQASAGNRSAAPQRPYQCARRQASHQNRSSRNV